jgi:hypothetical protein
MAVERFNLKGYDFILTCSHCVAKDIIPLPDGLHISYVLTPMRYAWDMYWDYFQQNGNPFIPPFIHYLRFWDVTSSHWIGRFLNISKHAENRIKKFCQREAKAIYLLIDTTRFKIQRKREDFFSSANTGDHACVPKHLHEAFRQRQALGRAGTGLPVGLHRLLLRILKRIDLAIEVSILWDIL